MKQTANPPQQIHINLRFHEVDKSNDRESRILFVVLAQGFARKSHNPKKSVFSS